MKLSKQQLRNTLRTKRRSLSQEERSCFSQLITAQLAQLPAFTKATNIAAYIARDGEVETEEIITKIWQLSKNCYLPIIQGFKQPLQFAKYTERTQLHSSSHFAVQEPTTEEFILPTEIDLVVTPLVGFSENCHRLGMGGGFYDITFQHKLADPGLKPQLVGVAFECQKTEDLMLQPWDVSLDLVVTECGVYQHNGDIIQLQYGRTQRSAPTGEY